MFPSVLIRLKDQFGATVAHPVCPLAIGFAKLAKAKTLTEDNLRTIVAMGFEIKLADEIAVSAARSAPLNRFGQSAASASRRIAQ